MILTLFVKNILKQFKTIQNSTKQFKTAQNRSKQFKTAQNFSKQFQTVQYSSKQHNIQIKTGGGHYHISSFHHFVIPASLLNDKTVEMTEMNLE